MHPPRRSRRLAGLEPDRVVQEVFYDPISIDQETNLFELAWILFIFLILVIFYSFIIFS